jgi:hypothetical protein
VQTKRLVPQKDSCKCGKREGKGKHYMVLERGININMGIMPVLEGVI